MQIRNVLAAAAAAVLFATPAVLSAQTQTPAAATLPTGKWTGTVTPPGAETADIIYDVTLTDNVYAITLDAGPHGKFPTTQVEYKDGKISFFFSPGPRLLCVLSPKEDGSYAGLCTDGGNQGGAAEIVMVPPKPASN